MKPLFLCILNFILMLVCDILIEVHNEFLIKSILQLVCDAILTFKLTVCIVLISPLDN